MKPLDHTRTYKKYAGLWIALKPDQTTIITSGNTAKEVLDKAKEIGHKQPVLFRVPTEILPRI